MYNFVLQTIFLLSFGAIIYLFARAVPRVDESAVSAPRRNYLDELLKKMPLEKADALVGGFLEKFLRKVKIIVLKMDNLLTKHLQSLKPTAQDAAKPTLFEKKEDNNIQ